MRYLVYLFILTVLGPSLGLAAGQDAETLKIGMNRPESGPYVKIGLDQERAAILATGEINQAGGILGKPIELVMLDSRSDPVISAANVLHLIQKDMVSMVFGGASSGVALRVSQVCQDQKTVFMATVTAANAMKDDREKCLDAGMNDNLSKPINPDELIDMIAAF